VTSRLVTGKSIQLFYSVPDGYNRMDWMDVIGECTVLGRGYRVCRVGSNNERWGEGGRDDFALLALAGTSIAGILAGESPSFVSAYTLTLYKLKVLIYVLLHI
jgi:hypothetical protein